MFYANISEELLNPAESPGKVGMDTLDELADKEKFFRVSLHFTVQNRIPFVILDNFVPIRHFSHC